ncbi:MAG: hypothetical protein V4598_02225 [Bdellovibrionota bacterium]
MRNFIFILAILTTHSALAEVKVSYNDEITPKSLTKLEENIKKAASKIKAGEERKVVIDLGSGGGNLYAALSFVGRINEISSKNNVVIDTRVRSSCESSCTILFTAGNQRRAGRFAQFGFHSPAIASKVPKGMDRKVILEEARRVWLDAVSAVDPTLTGILIKRKLLLDDEMTYLSRGELGTGYVTDRE